MQRFLGLVGVMWGLGGVLFVLLYAIFRLTPLAVDSFQFEFLWYHWVLLFMNVIFMAWTEGYKGFQLAFSPRVAARLRWLYENPTWGLVLAAPLFSMSYFNAPLRRRVVALMMTLGIFGLIILVRSLEQPWRGIADAGVVVGLSYGVMSLLWFVVLAFKQESFQHSPELREKS